MSLFIQQTKTVIVKNFLFYSSKKEIIKELLVPLISAWVFYVGRPTSQQQQQGDDENPFKFMNSMISLMLPLYLPGTITGYAKKLLINYVNEKHERYKETQKIMGLTQRAYLSGWLITSYLAMGIIGLITILSLYFSGYEVNGSFSIIAINYSVYLIASIHQILAISTFFSSPKLAGEIGIFFISMASLLFFYLTYGTKVSDTTFALVCLFPQAAISFSILQPQQQSTQPATSNQNDPVSDISQSVLGNQYNYKIASFMLFVDIFVYILLYFYLEEIIPNEYGIKRSPFFIFKKKFWSDFLFKKTLRQKSNYVQFDDQLNENDGQSNNHMSNQHVIELGNDMKNIQNESLLGEKKKNSNNSNILNQQSSLYTQNSNYVEPNQNPLLIDVIDLKKHFKSVHAVDGISMKLFQNEILCLLGHNGAGKTTTISLLTGLIEKTGGKILYFGDELEENIDKIRQNLGICNQKDVLYNYMTVTQHLEFIAGIKGISSDQVKQEVQNIINEVGLQNEKDKLAENLSGGNKRKLSLGMALVGGSKIIYLDEPTSGMDAVSRQQIWKILEIIKNSRSIVLTTHHLEEAERLSDRIIIMSKGKKKIEGHSDDIKREYGVGYHLTLSAKSNEFKQQFEERKQYIKQFVLQSIQGSEYNVQSSKDCIKFILPFKSIDQFSEAFQFIEKEEFINISLSINSLEDVFIKIGIEDEISDGGLNILSNDQNSHPIALYNSPKYSFFNQFLAMFQRQYYMTIRNWSAILMILLPIAEMLLGVYVAKHFIDNLEKYFDVLDDATGDKNQSKQLKESFVFPLKMYFLNIFIVQAYSINTSIYVNTPVLERETQIKYALNIMGCRPLPYWLGTLAFDYTVYFITFLIFYISIYSARVEFLIPYLKPLFIIMACFGFSLITFCYICGIFFQNSNSAFKYFPIIALFVNYTIPSILLMITRFSLPDLYQILQYVTLLLSPFLTLEKALANIDSQKRMGQAMQSSDLRGSQIFSKWQHYSIAIIVQGIVYMIGVMIYERKYYSLAGSNQDVPQDLEEQVDEGVQNEINRVQDPNNRDPIKCDQIYKVYPSSPANICAVRGTTFGVEKGQIFGLLGPNGAGKTTTFGMITANIAKTRGQIYLNNKNINESSSIYFDNIGVCPQNNCLWEYLKAKEHLNVFGRVKGLSGKDLKEVVGYYLKYMQLSHYKVQSSKLSGGNKRKLCVANCLIASPSLQFYDEPSTGLDPIAKRYLWKCLKDILQKKESSIVLTTHSLQEAEDLCDKVGIQVNGKFKCLDNLQILKSRKGQGYKIIVNLIDVPQKNQDQINRLIKQQYPDAEILNQQDIKSYDERIVYKVPSQHFLFSKSFFFLQNLKHNKIIEDFSITQASLEDIFIQYSQYQNEPSNQIPNNNRQSCCSIFSFLRRR
ncbi:ABC transporter family protein (macronuclear) [Tetrahymena thermophila SB210]|uniref:ABC transporter family protein n=1 Tax=Tetrahymena thermophila (strain SB210) TaxID=312017 RepID=Q22WX4_TETTS|nr:ABC transporter family protein [Tetrahymena thermophila SB210]EAR89872.2 ABC transporter family protein [Tetrahymena thermophila SB210]|eukprot:XP_001010117.2 ABC transporter family protein [Tetrahymena thermophila SB210]